MITGNIKDSNKYYSVNQYFEEVFENLKNTMLVGDYTYSSKNVNINPVSISTSDVLPNGEKKVFEAHKQYIDIHYIIEGEEAFGYSNINNLKAITEYNSDGDYQLFDGPINKIILKKGDFCIVFPEDAHIPCMNVDDESTVKRCVVKIML